MLPAAAVGLAALGGAAYLLTREDAPPPAPPSPPILPAGSTGTLGAGTPAPPARPPAVVGTPPSYTSSGPNLGVGRLLGTGVAFAGMAKGDPVSLARGALSVSSLAGDVAHAITGNKLVGLATKVFPVQLGTVLAVKGATSAGKAVAKGVGKAGKAVGSVFKKLF